MIFEYYSQTDPGLIRENNEDSVSLDPANQVVVLADGMGGYNAGEVASAMATQWVMQDLEPRLRTPHPPATHEVRRWLEQSVEQANLRILDASLCHPEYQGMGTTLVVAVFFGSRLLVGHIGDSRLYRLRQGQLVPLTRDHSLLQTQIDAGLISRELARNAQHKNLVTRALGIAAGVETEVSEHMVQAGDTYLLCSDGLNDMLSDAQIAATLKREPALETAGQALLTHANRAGGRDNISLVLVQCAPEPAHPRSTPRVSTT